MTNLLAELGPSARAATAAQAAVAGDFVVIAVPLKVINNMPVAELAGKIVIDTNNYMPGRDGNFPAVDNSPLSESWRCGPGTRVWHRSLAGGQGRSELVRNLAAAQPIFDV